MGVEVSRLSNGLTVATETIPHVESVALGHLGQVGRAQRTRRRARHRASSRTHGVQGHRQAHRLADRLGNRRMSAARSMPPPASRRRPSTPACLRDDVPLAVDILADILTGFEIRRRRTRARAARDPAGDRRRARHARRHRLRPLHRNRVPPPDDRPLDPRHAGDREILHFRSSYARFMDRQYGAERMVVVAAGDIKHDDFVREVEKQSRLLPQPSRQRRRRNTRIMSAAISARTAT